MSGIKMSKKACAGYRAQHHREAAGSTTDGGVMKVARLLPAPKADT
jgi:hypothetical protein